MSQPKDKLKQTIDKLIELDGFGDLSKTETVIETNPQASDQTEQPNPTE